MDSLNVKFIKTLWTIILLHEELIFNYSRQSEESEQMLTFLEYMIQFGLSNYQKTQIYSFANIVRIFNPYSVLMIFNFKCISEYNEHFSSFIIYLIRKQWENHLQYYIYELLYLHHNDPMTKKRFKKRSQLEWEQFKHIYFNLQSKTFCSIQRLACKSCITKALWNVYKMKMLWNA